VPFRATVSRMNIVRFLALAAATTVSAFILVGCCCGLPIAGGPTDLSEISGKAPVQARAEIPPPR
jgi:hypothetical protein